MECFLLPTKSTKDHRNRQGTSAVPVKHVTQDIQAGSKGGHQCAGPYKLGEQGSALTSRLDEKRDAQGARASAARPQTRDRAAAAARRAPRSQSQSRPVYQPPFSGLYHDSNVSYSFFPLTPFAPVTLASGSVHLLPLHSSPRCL